MNFNVLKFDILYFPEGHILGWDTVISSDLCKAVAIKHTIVFYLFYFSNF